MYKNKIKEIRNNCNMTQKEFSDYLRIPKRSIEDWEAGRRKPPDYLINLIKYKIENEKKAPSR